MSEPPEPEAKSEEIEGTPRAPRRVTLDVVLRRDPRNAPPAHASVPVSRQRWWVMTFFLAFCAASSYAWVELRGHPIAAYLTALPQIGALLGAGVTLLAGGDPTLSRTWFQARAIAALAWVDRRARAVCACLGSLIALLIYAGNAMAPIEIDCPPGCRLAYGHLGAQLACDQHDDRVWMPFGLEEVASTFECSLPGGHGDWAPLRRLVRDAEGTRESFTCYEDGERVASHHVRRELAFVEYGWQETAPERDPAPCDHLPIGVYDYDPSANTCRWLASLDDLSAMFRATLESSSGGDAREALVRLIGSECHDCPPAPGDSEPDIAPNDDAAAAEGDAGVPHHVEGAVRHARAPSDAAHATTGCPHPHVAPLAFFHPGACHRDFGSISLDLAARQVEISVGISYRGSSERRCVPSEYRRDGFIHLFLPDGELVFGVTREAPHEVVLIEDVRSTRPPPALALTCPE